MQRVETLDHQVGTLGSHFNHARRDARTHTKRRHSCASSTGCVCSLVFRSLERVDSAAPNETARPADRHGARKCRLWPASPAPPTAVPSGLPFPWRPPSVPRHPDGLRPADSSAGCSPAQNLPGARHARATIMACRAFFSAAIFPVDSCSVSADPNSTLWNFQSNHSRDAKLFALVATYRTDNIASIKPRLKRRILDCASPRRPLSRRCDIHF